MVSGYSEINTYIQSFRRFGFHLTTKFQVSQEILPERCRTCKPPHTILRTSYSICSSTVSTIWKTKTKGFKDVNKSRSHLDMSQLVIMNFKLFASLSQRDCLAPLSIKNNEGKHLGSQRSPKNQVFIQPNRGTLNSKIHFNLLLLFHHFLHLIELTDVVI